MRIINQALKFNRLPSEILRIDDEYTAFCFDEACLYIINQIENKKKPHFKDEKVDSDKDKYYLNDFLRKEAMKGGK